MGLSRRATIIGTLALSGCGDNHSPAQSCPIDAPLVDASFCTEAECIATVSYFKNHPGILGWMVGNEFNYNNLYGAANFDSAISIVKAAMPTQ